MNKLFTLLSIIIVFACSNKERKCSDFKTGKFKFSQEINGIKHSSILIRTEMYQIESYKGKTDTATVHWINDCEFILRKLHPKNLTEKKAISINIISTDDNGYTFDYSYVGESHKQRGTAIKIN